MRECNKKGESPLVIYHKYIKLKENVYVNKKRKKSFDESPLGCVCELYKFLLSCVHWSLKLGWSSSYVFLEWCCRKKENLIFPLSPYKLPWPRPLVVIRRTILVDTPCNDLLCHPASNSRNQRQGRDVIHRGNFMSKSV